MGVATYNRTVHKISRTKKRCVHRYNEIRLKRFPSLFDRRNIDGSIGFLY